MRLIDVNFEKCNHDGICVASCPVGVLRMNKKNSTPMAVLGAEKICINCGHCVAVCPSGALLHQSIQHDDCIPIQDSLNANPEQIEQLLKSRRSIRTYKKEAVKRERLSKLIDIARYAPSGHNAQPVNWAIVYESKKVQELANHTINWMRDLIDKESPLANMLFLKFVVNSYDKGADNICRNAPHIILTHAHKENRAAMVACTIALNYLEIAAAADKIGTCWAGFFLMAAKEWGPMQDELDLPEGHLCQGAMLVGYPKFKYHRIPTRKDASVSWI